MSSDGLLDGYRLSIREHFFTSIVLNLLQLLHRILRDDFLPSNEDILHIKCGTCGVEDEIIFRNGNYFRFIRAAMMKSSIHKWVQFFEDVDAIIFIASLPGYDSYVEINSKKVRLRDDMDYFEAICNSKWFTKCTTVFLILNKCDLFQQKLAITPLKICFPDYEGNFLPSSRLLLQRTSKHANFFKKEKLKTVLVCFRAAFLANDDLY
ncbi:Guanine nucleotide-binding protein G i subunit alpha-2 [Taenia solium]|eukprot:TsM_000453300 transcript=TsM_000453300 gene=TsM_000453300